MQAINPLPAAWVSKLIAKMQVMYGAKFTQQWAGIPPEVLQAEWALELAGFTGPELARGLAACRKRTFPPTLPEFMALCRPPIDADVAFHEAVRGLNARKAGERGEWSHPAIFHAALEVGQFDILNSTYAHLKARWVRVLADQMAKGHWDPVPDVAKALPAPAPISKEEASKVMKQLGAGEVAESPSKKDPKAWARRLLDNPKGKATPGMLAMARRALGIDPGVTA